MLERQLTPLPAAAAARAPRTERRSEPPAAADCRFRQSISRSAVFIIAHLMRTRGLSAVAATQLMKGVWGATWPCDRCGLLRPLSSSFVVVRLCVPPPFRRRSSLRAPREGFARESRSPVSVLTIFSQSRGGGDTQHEDAPRRQLCATSFRRSSSRFVHQLVSLSDAVVMVVQVRPPTRRVRERPGAASRRAAAAVRRALRRRRGLARRRERARRRRRRRARARKRRRARRAVSAPVETGPLQAAGYESV